MRTLLGGRFWLAAVVGSGLLALVEAASLHLDAVRSGRDSDFGSVLLVRLAADAIWIAIAAVVFVAASARVGAARLGALAAVLAPLAVLWGVVAQTLLGRGDFGERLQAIAAATLLWDMFLVGALAVTCSVIVVARRSRQHERDAIELRARLAHAELELLRGQLEPHFLFNALNTIAGLIRGAHLELATGALTKLSELLRYVIEASRQPQVPLAWELELVTNYLELQQMRYGARLQFTIRDDARARSWDVPPLLLQPLVENAVVHGAARTTGPTTIDVHAAADDAGLRVAIHNTCDAQAAPNGETTGVGLSNTRQRLERMYGSAFALDAGPDGPAHYRATIVLPPLGDAAEKAP